MGEDNVLLLVGEGGEGSGVPGGEPGVVETLVAGVGRFVPGVVEIQVVKQGSPDGSVHVQPEQPGHPVGTEGHKQGVVQRSHRTVVLPPAHHPHRLGVQQFSGQLHKLPFPQLTA